MTFEKDLSVEVTSYIYEFASDSYAFISLLLDQHSWYDDGKCTVCSDLQSIRIASANQTFDFSTIIYTV